MALPAYAFVPQPLTRPHRAALPAALYLGLAAVDLLGSLAAFSVGIAEGNPFMAWLLAMNWFIPGKILISLFVTALILVVYGHSPRWRGVAWAGVWVMAGVSCLHLWALPHLILVAGR